MCTHGLLACRRTHIQRGYDRVQSLSLLFDIPDEDWVIRPSIPASGEEAVPPEGPFLRGALGEELALPFALALGHLWSTWWRCFRQKFLLQRSHCMRISEVVLHPDNSHECLYAVELVDVPASAHPAAMCRSIRTFGSSPLLTGTGF